MSLPGSWATGQFGGGERPAAAWGTQRRAERSDAAYCMSQRQTPDIEVGRCRSPPADAPPSAMAIGWRAYPNVFTRIRRWAPS
jgi:hypothetical protein